ncbi:MAG: AI-2E family transporter [Holophagae bacterium]|nr:MAG: AI-2E family transporter [Holophagae bacterium]
MGLTLSERQQRTVAAALTILSAVVIVATVGGVFWLVGVFFSRFASVFLPLAVAGVAALVCQPYFEWLRDRLRLGRVLALVAVFLSVIIPLVAFFWFFGSLLVGQLGDLIAKLPEWWQDFAAWAAERAPQVEAFIEKSSYLQSLKSAVAGREEAIVQGLEAVGRGALNAGVSVASFVISLFGWFVAPVYFAFFLLADSPGKFEVQRFLPFLKEETRNDVAYLFRQFVEIVVAFFRGQLIVAFLQGLLFAVGFSLVGLKYGFVIGMALGFLNIIPYLGSILGLATALPLAYFQAGGGLGRVALVILVFAVVQTIEAYLLTPKIMGDRTGLHPMVIIVAIFFWGSALGGITGMILAIPLTAFLVVFLRLAREKYVRELV